MVLRIPVIQDKILLIVIRSRKLRASIETRIYRRGRTADGCPPQKFMQPSVPSRILGVVHPGRGEPLLCSGAECDANVPVV